MPAEGFGGPQVCKIVGITYRQLDHWDRTGLKSPSLTRAKGSGTQRLYSYRDVVDLRLIKQLLEGGVSLQRARKAIEFLRDAGEDIGAADLVLGATGAVLVREGENLLDVLRGGQGVFSVVQIAGVVEEVDAAIVELSATADADADADAGAAGAYAHLTDAETKSQQVSGQPLARPAHLA